MDLIKELKENTERNIEMERMLKESAFLNGLPDREISLHYTNMAACFLIQVQNDYLKLVGYLRECRVISGEMKVSTNWYSCGRMMFSWHSDLIHMWFSCDPEHVPSELMPSTSCKVVKSERPAETSYDIVCEI